MPLACEKCGATPAKSYPLKRRKQPRILCREHEAERQRRRASWFAAMDSGLATKGGNARVQKYLPDPQQASAQGWRLAMARWGQKSKEGGKRNDERTITSAANGD